MTEQVVIETKVEERVMNVTHTFKLKEHVEYYLTFSLPPEFHERDIDRHIFQVNYAWASACTVYTVLLNSR